MLDGLSIEPHEVLGIPPDASPSEVREAFRAKSKKYHPDAGGDEWAFRIVTRAYQILSARTRRRHPGHRPSRPIPTETVRLRQGIHDRDLDPTRIVAIEVVCRRYASGDFLALLGLPPKQRDLDGSLQMTWPDPQSKAALPPPEITERILAALHSAFDDLRARIPATSAHSRTIAGRFEARLAFAEGPLASEAFKRLHVSLRARGLGVRQWTRDITVPREPVY